MMNRNGNLVFLPSAEEEREHVYTEDQSALPDSPTSYNGLSGLGSMGNVGALEDFSPIKIWNLIKSNLKPLALGMLLGGGIMWYENRTGFFQNLLRG